MEKDILLTDDLEKVINDSGVYDRLIPFGFGKLMPIYSTGVETHVLIIAHSGMEREVGQLVSAQQAYDDAMNHAPLPIVGLSFPANQDGLKAIDSFKEWLDTSKKRIEEELEVLSQEWIDNNVVHVRGLGDIIEAAAVENLLVPKKEVLTQEWIDEHSVAVTYDGIPDQTEVVYVDDLEKILKGKGELNE